MLADDEPDLRRLLRARLVRNGFEVLEADNGIAALDLVRCHRPAAVVLDYRMPGMTGGEVCGQIKSDPALQGTPVILVTASTQSARDESSGALQADDVVIKPFEFSDFYERLQRLLP